MIYKVVIISVLKTKLNNHIISISLLSNLDNNELYDHCIIMCMYLGVHFRMLHVSCLHPNALYS